MNRHTLEVESKLRALAPKQKQTAYFDLQSYMGTEYEMLGMTVPQQRALFKQGYSFSSLPLPEQWNIWNTVWKETILFEAITQAALFAEKNISKTDVPFSWKIVKAWVGKVDNWGHSDMLSGFYGKLLQRDDAIYKQLEKWNSSRKPWERRQSLVTLAMFYRSSDAIPFNQSVELILPLINDDDYFVQKGLGWMLREAGNRFPDELWHFLLHNCAQLTSTAFTTAIEKRSKEQKEHLKELRKADRLSKKNK